MRRIDSTTYHHKIGEIAHEVAYKGEPVTVTSHGRDQMVIVNVYEYALLEKAHSELKALRLGVLREEAAPCGTDG